MEKTTIDTLIHRRLAVPTDLGGYKHSACIFSKNSILSYGQNYLLPKHSTYNSIHAEQDAIMKLETHTKKHLKKVSILVVRTSKTGKIGMSKPCTHCIKAMNDLAREKGYYISNVYYSTNEGTIVKEKLTEIKGVLSGYYKSLKL